jgi:hypothetical protein
MLLACDNYKANLSKLVPPIKRSDLIPCSLMNLRGSAHTALLPASQGVRISATREGRNRARIRQKLRPVKEHPALHYQAIRTHCGQSCGTSTCPLWLRSRHRSKSSQCPLYPQKRTLIERSGMSAKCQKQTFCAAVKNVGIRSPRRPAAAYAVAPTQLSKRVSTTTGMLGFRSTTGVSSFGRAVAWHYIEIKHLRNGGHVPRIGKTSIHATQQAF